MARLIDELKKDHSAITSLLDRLKDSRVTNKEAHQILLSAQASLLAHLKKEDLQLYPVLHGAAEKDPALKRTVDFYARDMDEITRKAGEFFQKYSRDDAPIDIEFAKAFGNLFATISRRLRSEENMLYKEYEKIRP
ncbi:MAG TPA: hemerythrin domain-containing protein [Geomonas sp.]|nr:hemerythrin domain-containing protein [Geomonas sp.]